MKGQKTGGRQKGTPNKSTAEIRNFFASLIFDNMQLIMQDFQQLTTEQRMVLLPKILPYILPKMKPQTEDEADEQERKAEQLMQYRQHAEQLFNLMEQNQQEQNWQDNIPRDTSSATEQILQPENKPLETDNTNNENTDDNKTTTTTQDRTDCNNEPESVRSEFTLSDSNTEDNTLSDFSCEYNTLAEVIPTDYLSTLRQKMHNYLYEEIKRRFSEQPEQSEQPNNISATSDSSDLSDSSQQPAPHTHLLKPTSPSQHIPFYKSLNTKKTYNKRRKRR